MNILKKILTITERHEGESCRTDSLFSIIKNYQSDGKFRSWKFKIESPFTVEKSYVDPETFDNAIGLCSKWVLIEVQPQAKEVKEDRSFGSWIVRKSTAYIPKK